MTVNVVAASGAQITDKSTVSGAAYDPNTADNSATTRPKVR
jgi:hypothetical protein